jgi:tetratricopeptide (TPR) repeat protein
MNRARLVFLLGMVVLVGGSLISCGGEAENTPLWHLDQGKMLVGQGHYDNAIQECTEAIQLEPMFAEAYFWRAIAYYQLAKYPLAVADCSQTIKLDPDLVEARITRAAAYCVSGQYNLAITDCNRVIEINSGMRGIAHLYRGYVYSRKGEHDLAIADRDRAVEIDPDLVYKAMSLICCIY